MPIRNLRLLFLNLILLINTIFPSIISDTLIKTPHGSLAVENIVVDDTIITYDQEKLSTATITNILTSVTNTIVAITTPKGTFYACSDQQFFDPILQKWIAAKDITTQNTFLDAELNHYACLNIKIIDAPATKTYCITTTYPHNFFITGQELLTHNHPVVIGIAWLFGEGLKFAGLTIGTTFLGSYVGVQLYNRDKKKQKDKYLDVSFVSGYGGYNPEPDDDKDHFELIKSNTDKKLRHKRFGNFYRDPKTKLWWSKDNANHGGSAFKVFKETAKGLEWIFDADHLGNQIIAKHKGPIGSFITYKELISCP